MANADTVKAIEDNLTAILSAQGFLVEDSSSEPKLESKTLAVIRFAGEEFENPFGQRPSYSNVRFIIELRFVEKSPALARDRAIDAAQKLRTNITVNALNVGVLAASLLVSKVDHRGYEADYEPQMCSVAYGFSVRYRET